MAQAHVASKERARRIVLRARSPEVLDDTA
jgi:hypothetical protein